MPRATSCRVFLCMSCAIITTRYVISPTRGCITHLRKLILLLKGSMLALVSCVEGVLSNLAPSRWLTVLVNRMWHRHGWSWSCCTVALTVSVPDLGSCRSKCHHDIQLVVDYQMCRCVKCSCLISTKIFRLISLNTNVLLHCCSLLQAYFYLNKNARML